MVALIPVTDDLSQLSSWMTTEQVTGVMVVLLSCVLAWGLEWSYVVVVHATSAMTMQVCLQGLSPASNAPCSPLHHSCTGAPLALGYYLLPAFLDVRLGMLLVMSMLRLMSMMALMFMLVRTVGINADVAVDWPQSLTSSYWYIGMSALFVLFLIITNVNIITNKSLFVPTSS